MTRAPSAWQAADPAKLLDEIPSGVVVLDRDLAIVEHNRAFAEIFGETRGRRCYEVTRGRGQPCPVCPARETFSDGRSRVVEQLGRDRLGRDTHYLVHVTPLADDDGGGRVAAIITDLTATKRLQREYQTLFEKVPCFVAVINRDHRVVKANEAFRRTFGEPTGESCYRLYKQRGMPCGECPVDQTFADGKSHTSRQVGTSRDGRLTHYLVFTAPLVEDGGEISHVIEMALDMTEHEKLQEQLERANVLRKALVDSSLDSIVVLDEEQKIVLVNPAAESLLGQSSDVLVGRRLPRRLVPQPIGDVLSGDTDHLSIPETEVPLADGSTVPVRLVATRLELADQQIGTAIFAQDLREMKRLESDKLEAERLAAVGQTVAGLAHGIKNIITGLEGGMYVTSSGMRRGDQERVNKGWEMLSRNMGRISELTKNLLAFSRGESFEPEQTDIAAVARDVVELYRDKAAEHGITLRAELPEGVEPAWMDPEGIHSCLANLVSNAVDACMVSDGSPLEVVVRVTEQDGTIICEVVDTGCGMDYEVKQKAFTSFFTTKGKGGTGLGLLLTRKIVQQHGGGIEFDSAPGEGTTFRVSFPRRRLPRGGSS